MGNEAKNEGFYDELYSACLAELKGRGNWSEAYEPILAQYVFKMTEANRLMLEIQGTAVDMDHTNKANATNKASSPKWRMFLELTRAAAALAKDLRLNPHTAPAGGPVKKPKGLESKMKVA